MRRPWPAHGLARPRSYTHRKEYRRWITDAKKEETRLKRLRKAFEMLKKGISTCG
jgi:uncharacterized protein YdeI (YjbR/CyaY-like superfamily)